MSGDDWKLRETSMVAIDTMTITKDEFMGALQRIQGGRFDQGVLTDEPGSSLVIEHDKACMRAFFERMTGQDVEIIRVCGRQLRDTGRYPWA